MWAVLRMREATPLFRIFGSTLASFAGMMLSFDAIGFGRHGVSHRARTSSDNDVQGTSALGQNRKYSTRANDFRFAPKSGHCATDSACPFRAKTGSDHFGVDLPRPGENHPAKMAQPTHLRLCAAFSASVS